MDTKYIAGDNIAFITFIKEKGVGNRAQIISVEGHNRWLITEENGDQYIARPNSEESHES